MLLLALLLILIPSQSGALAFYFDRSSFDSAAGSYTLLTLDAPNRIDVSFPDSTLKATYGDLMTFTFDLVGGVGVNVDGTVTLGRTGLGASGAVLSPVYSFGFDIVDANPTGRLNFFGVPVLLDHVGFLGVVSSVPILAAIDTPIGNPGGIPGTTGGSFVGLTIDNVAVGIPEAPMSLLLLVSLASVAIGRLIWNRV
jgi:hypothetical protein